MELEKLDRLIKALRDYRKSVADSARCAAVRSSLDPSSTRARLTSANARWSRAAEERDRIAGRIEALVQECGFGQNIPGVATHLTPTNNESRSDE